jgi:hypothetical protein
VRIFSPTALLIALLCGTAVLGSGQSVQKEPTNAGSSTGSIAGTVRMRLNDHRRHSNMSK